MNSYRWGHNRIVPGDIHYFGRREKEVSDTYELEKILGKKILKNHTKNLQFHILFQGDSLGSRHELCSHFSLYEVTHS